MRTPIRHDDVLLLPVDAPPASGTAEVTALDAVAPFCRTRNVQPSRVAVVGHLEVALITAGP